MAEKIALKGHGSESLRLPFARLWLFRSRDLLQSTYVGCPGIGVDNPVSLYAAGDGDVLERAHHYVERLISKSYPYRVREEDGSDREPDEFTVKREP